MKQAATKIRSKLLAALAIFSLVLFQFPPSVVAVGEDPGLNSGNATVDRSSVPGQTILLYQTTGASTFTAPRGVTSVRVLVVGGGGGGGVFGGGGGAGGVIANSSVAVTPGDPLAITVGTGGAGAASRSVKGSNGGDSVFDTLTAVGGGGGGSDNTGTYIPSIGDGANGGSGGGASNRGAAIGGTGTTDQGNNGANAVGSTHGGGGGGAGGTGQRATSTVNVTDGGDGGLSITNNITGSNVAYAGGGGAQYGGSGGGAGAGNGAGANFTQGGDATANTGSGGGGGANARGGNGGSGVVIIQFETQDPLNATVTVSDDVTSEDGDTGRFCLTLSAQPSADVTIALSSSNTNEVTVPASITITPANWNSSTNCVTATGVDDSPPVADGPVTVTITTGDVTSADPLFDALDGSTIDDVTIYNQNNDPPGIVLDVIDNATSEKGGTATVRFRLLSQPAGGASVSIPLSLSDTSEGDLGGVSSVTISNANWNTPVANEITVTGLDDNLDDGDIIYQLVTGDPTSTDTDYNNLTAADVLDLNLTNADDDPDGDNDGILNNTEAAAPNSGDGNNDGTVDSDQANVASFVSQVTGRYATLEVDEACQINSVSVTAESSNATADSGFNYPAGLMNFTTACGASGFTTTVVQYYYGVSNESLILRKYNPTTNAYFTVPGATLEQVTIGGQSAVKVTYQVTDGGDLDTDGTANGTIVDPVGLAEQVVGAPNTGLGGRYNYDDRDRQ